MCLSVTPIRQNYFLILTFCVDGVKFSYYIENLTLFLSPLIYLTILLSHPIVVLIQGQTS